MKNTVKIWPDLDDISQALIPYSDSRLNPKNTIFIDLSNVQNVTSSGAALSIVKLLKIIQKFQLSTWSVIEPEKENVKSFMQSIGYYNVLNKNLLNKDLWWQLPSLYEMKAVNLDIPESLTTSFRKSNQLIP